MIICTCNIYVNMLLVSVRILIITLILATSEKGIRLNHSLHLPSPSACSLAVRFKPNLSLCSIFLPDVERSETFDFCCVGSIPSPTHGVRLFVHGSLSNGIYLHLVLLPFGFMSILPTNNLFLCSENAPFSCLFHRYFLKSWYMLFFLYWLNTDAILIFFSSISLGMRLVASSCFSSTSMFCFHMITLVLMIFLKCKMPA